MNFVFNTGYKTNQVKKGYETTKVNSIPQDKQIKKVIIYYSDQIERFKFFDKLNNLIFEAGRKGQDEHELEVELSDDECIMGVQAQERDRASPSLYTNMQLMIRKM